MKIDIEGGEWDAVEGMCSLLKREKFKGVIIELADWATGRSGRSTTKLRNSFEEAGYRFHVLDAGRVVRLPPSAAFTGQRSSAAGWFVFRAGSLPEPGEVFAGILHAGGIR